MKENLCRQFAIYSRKSRYTGKGESIENQVELCRQYIASHGIAEEAEKALVYEDEGFSGGTLERPQFRKMMREAGQRGVTAIVVYRLDRISRNIGDFAGLIEELGNRGIDFISIREQFDTSSPMGRAMMYIASVFSQLERETIAERIRDNMRELAKTGRWLGGMTPLGYTSESVSRVTIDGKIKKACRLQGNPEEIGIVKILFETFLETGSLTKAEQLLAEKRLVTRRGNPFSRFAIKGILTNPVYMIADETAYRYFAAHGVEVYAEPAAFDGQHGVMVYNRTLQKPGKTHQYKPMAEWIVSIGGHEGVIPGEVWTAVQNLLGRYRSGDCRLSRSKGALLSGMLFCGICGGIMRSKQTDRVNDRGEPVYRYLCSTREHGRGAECTMKSTDGNLLDAAVLAELGNLRGDGAAYRKQMPQIRKCLAADKTDRDTELQGLQQSLAEAENAVRCLAASLAKSQGAASEAYILREMEKYHEKNETLRQRILALEASYAQAGLSAEEMTQMGGKLSVFRDVIQEMALEQKRSAVRMLVAKAVWDGERVQLYLTGAEDLCGSEPEREGGAVGGPLREDSK